MKVLSSYLKSSLNFLDSLQTETDNGESQKKIVKIKTKIPPPILATLMIGLVYLSTLLFEPITFEYQEALSILIVIIGLACALSSFRLFSRHKTTISPFTPSETAVLLTEGMYRYSRNPM